MNAKLIDKIAQAVLYEGYILYPYRRGTKNQQRWTFGGVFPRDYSEAVSRSEPAMIQTQCLLHAEPHEKVIISVRFLQLVDRQVARQLPGGELEPVDSLQIAGKQYQSWQEAIERTVTIEGALSGDTPASSFRFGVDRAVESLIQDGMPIGALVRTRAAIEGRIEFIARREGDDLFQITVRVANLTPLPAARQLTREQAQIHSMVSTHVVLCAADGEFLSQIDPPPDVEVLSGQCKNVGVWPVLVGEPGATDCMLSAPIILYDYPQIAPESPGDLFDGTEIDEILSLRVMTLTDEEKQSAVDLDPRAALLIGRTESLARDQLARLHGTMRPPKKVRAVHIGDAELQAGDRVRLTPRGGADAFDIILRGKIATIAAIEQDFENRIHLAVTVDDDPGADIGAAGKIGHRFSFRPDEVEPYRAGAEVAES